MPKHRIQRTTRAGCGTLAGMRAQNAQWWPPSGGPEVLR